MATKRKEEWWRRQGTPRSGFRYRKADGTAVRSAAALKRIRELAIPPAWTDVHIATDPKAKVQAWGRDGAGRKQYIYSKDHVHRSSSRKWRRVAKLGKALPELRAATSRDLRRKGLDKRKVCATIVRLMSRGFFRAGGERYAVENKTFGICTLTKRHLNVQGRDLVFTYRGKRGVQQRQVIVGTPLANIVKSLQKLPGKRLFQYRDADGKICAITAADVNEYLRDTLGERYTSKDLRTFGGTVRAATILADIGPPRSDREAKKTTTLASRLVAYELGNTPAICKSAYIHPAVLERYLEKGRTIEPFMRKTARGSTPRTREPATYYPEEAALLRFLEAYG